MGLLELLRLAIVAIVAVMLNQPEWIEEFRPEEKPTIAVLWDASPAWRPATSSAPTSRRPRPRPAARRSRRWPIPRRGTSSGTDERRHPAVLVAAPAGRGGRTAKADGVIARPRRRSRAGRGTDLFEPLARAPERIANLRGIVLASDGDWNEGPPPVQAAARLRIKGVPVLAVPVGSRTRLPDVELLSLDVPTFGIAGKSVRVPFTIDSSLPRDYVTTVTLKTSDGDQVTKEVRIAADGPHQRLARSGSRRRPATSR